MTRKISAVAVCCSSASVRSRLRASSSVNRRTFSMAMTAWSANVWSRASCLAENGSTSILNRSIVPMGTPSRSKGVATMARWPSACWSSRPTGNSPSGSLARSWMWIVRRSDTARPVTDALVTGSSTPSTLPNRRTSSSPDRPEIGWGARDGAEDLGGGRLLLQRLGQVAVARLELLEQAHVLDGDDGLVGEGLEEGNLRLGKGAHLGTQNGQVTKRLALAQ